MRLLVVVLLFLTTYSSALVIHEPSELNYAIIHNVGFVGNGTGVYLKNGYVITNAHVGCNIFIDSKKVKHRPDYNTYKVLENTDGTQTDIALFRIADYNNFNELSLAAEIQEKQEIILIGSGYGTKEKIMLNDKFLIGYSVDLVRKMRLGFANIITISSPKTIANYTTHMFKSVFLPCPNGAQATPGDSGGAAIVFSGGEYKLGGLITAVTNDDLATFGVETFYINLSKYKEEIEKIINP